MELSQNGAAGFLHLLKNDPPSDWEEHDMQSVQSNTDSNNYDLSQIPNQDYIARIDEDVSNLPKQLYISTLLKTCNHDDNLITWYRTILLNRSRGIDGCPTGTLKSRQTSQRSTSSEKYATDCYMLNMFLNGDNTSIKELFTKHIQTSQNTYEHASFEPQTRHQSMSELSSLVHECVDKVNNLEIKLKEQEKKNTKNEETIDLLLKKNERLQNLYEQIRHEHSSKLTILETFRKRADNAIKNVGEFDNDINEIKLQQIRDSVKKISTKTGSPQKHITEQRTNGNLATTNVDTQNQAVNTNQNNTKNTETIRTASKSNASSKNNIDTLEEPTVDTVIPQKYYSLFSNISKQDKQGHRRADAHPLGSVIF